VTPYSLVDKCEHCGITFHCHLLVRYKPNMWDDGPDTGNGNHFPRGCECHFQPGNSYGVHHHSKLVYFQSKYGYFTMLLIVFNVYFLFILANPLYCRALTFTSLAALCVIAPVTTTVSAPSIHSHCQFPYFRTTFCHAWLAFLL